MNKYERFILDDPVSSKRRMINQFEYRIWTSYGGNSFKKKGRIDFIASGSKDMMSTRSQLGQVG